jgi:hypothetical protein
MDGSDNGANGNGDAGGMGGDNGGFGGSSDATGIDNGTDALAAAGDPTGLGSAPGSEIDTLGGPDTIDAAGHIGSDPASFSNTASVTDYGMTAGAIGIGLSLANAAMNGTTLGAVAAAGIAIGAMSNQSLEQAAANVTTDVVSGMGLTGALAAEDPQGFGTFGTSTSGSTSIGGGGFDSADGSSTIAYYNEWAVSSQGGGG